jgi:hypothetical protein
MADAIQGRILDALGELFAHVIHRQVVSAVAFANRTLRKNNVAQSRRLMFRPAACSASFTILSATAVSFDIGISRPACAPN